MEHLPRAIPPGSSRERTELLLRLVPPESPDQMRPGYIKSLKHLLTLGITSFMEAFTSFDNDPSVDIHCRWRSIDLKEGPGSDASGRARSAASSGGRDHVVSADASDS